MHTSVIEGAVHSIRAYELRESRCIHMIHVHIHTCQNIQMHTCIARRDILFRYEFISREFSPIATPELEHMCLV